MLNVLQTFAVSLNTSEIFVMVFYTNIVELDQHVTMFIFKGPKDTNIVKVLNCSYYKLFFRSSALIYMFSVALDKWPEC